MGWRGWAGEGVLVGAGGLVAVMMGMGRRVAVGGVETVRGAGRCAAHGIGQERGLVVGSWAGQGVVIAEKDVGDEQGRLS